MPVSRIGSPPGRIRASPSARTPEATRDGELDPGVEKRHEQGEKREREDQVDPESRRIGDRRPEQEAGERRHVPHHEEAQLRAEQEGERALARARDDAERLVREEERRHWALARRQRELAAERDAVENVPHVEEQRRQHDLQARRADGERARRR